MMEREQLLAALWRLDKVLALAIRQAQAEGGAEQVSDMFRGLQIRDSDVMRILHSAPGMPLYVEACIGSGEPLAAGVGRIESLCRIFGLEPFDLDVIVLALAPEIDLRYERLYAYLQDDVTRKRPIVELALHLFAPDAASKLALRSRFAPSSPLVKHGLLHLIPDAAQAEPPLLAHYLKLEDQIVAYILGEDSLARELTSFCRLSEDLTPEDEVLDDKSLRPLLRFAAEARAEGRLLRLYLQGSAIVGKLQAARAVACAAGSRLLIVNVARAPEGFGGFRPAIELAFLTARLLNAVVYVEDVDGLRREGQQDFRTLLELVAESPVASILSGTIPLAGASTGMLTLRLDVLDRDRARECWQTQAAAIGANLDEHEITLLADRFRLTADQIADAVVSAANEARWLGAKPDLDRFCAAARAERGHELNRLARKVTPKYCWEDIILPEDQMEQLHEICDEAQHRETVFGDWGFGRKLSLGRGLNVLFSGPPGTGKTMAAEVIANELRLDLYKIDLSQVVSKYIGETEKNLDRVFTAAERSNAILFFDEADALFGKRSEVKDSHDRYANIEIGYLLQKMEEYEGIAILATNVKQHIDEAFVRRIQVIVEFPFPNEMERARVWKVIFPHEAPIHGDVDFPSLARTVRLASGNIRSIAKASAFYAAADGGVISMAHLVKASRREYQKLGREWTEQEADVPVTSRGVKA